MLSYPRYYDTGQKNEDGRKNMDIASLLLSIFVESVMVAFECNFPASSETQSDIALLAG